jgi:hypothetical protein
MPELVLGELNTHGQTHACLVSIPSCNWQASANQRPFAGANGSSFAGCASERTLIGQLLRYERRCAPSLGSAVFALALVCLALSLICKPIGPLNTLEEQHIVTYPG